MNCPVCNVPLLLSERQGVEIDYCPQCRGIWLDRSELDKIIERSVPGTAQGYQQKDQPYYDQQYNQPQHRPQHRRKKESFLSDLFDFD